MSLIMLSHNGEIISRFEYGGELPVKGDHILHLDGGSSAEYKIKIRKFVPCFNDIDDHSYWVFILEDLK